MVKIRFQRKGRAHAPVYTLVAVDERNARNSGNFLDTLAHYNPKSVPPLSKINEEGIKKWLKDGAQISPTARTLLAKQNISC